MDNAGETHASVIQDIIWIAQESFVYRFVIHRVEVEIVLRRIHAHVIADMNETVLELVYQFANMDVKEDNVLHQINAHADPDIKSSTTNVSHIAKTVVQVVNVLHQTHVPAMKDTQMDRKEPVVNRNAINHV